MRIKVDCVRKYIEFFDINRTYLSFAKYVLISLTANKTDDKGDASYALYKMLLEGYKTTTRTSSRRLLRCLKIEKLLTYYLYAADFIT